MQVVSICKFIIHLLTVVFHGSVSTCIAARRRVFFSATTPPEKVSDMKNQAEYTIIQETALQKTRIVDIFRRNSLPKSTKLPLKHPKNMPKIQRICVNRNHSCFVSFAHLRKRRPSRLAYTIFIHESRIKTFVIQSFLHRRQVGLHCARRQASHGSQKPVYRHCAATHRPLIERGEQTLADSNRRKPGHLREKHVYFWEKHAHFLEKHLLFLSPPPHAPRPLLRFLSRAHVRDRARTQRVFVFCLHRTAIPH